MHQIALIADDLTGASDAGVQFVRAGLRTIVLFDLDQLQVDIAAVDALAIDTDSRAISADDARRRSQRAAHTVRQAGFPHLYKKVDSTLRGNLGPEIDGVMDEIPFDVAIVAPAFPRMGRTTVAGRHYLGGVAIAETEIARDPKAPVRTSDIVALLQGQSRRRAGLVSLETVRSGADALRQAVERLAAEGVQLVVCDAQQDDDLQAITRAMAHGHLHVLWVGSAGLADSLPAQLGLAKASAASPEPDAAMGPVLLVAGSISATTRGQVEAVRQLSGVEFVELNPLSILANDEAQRQELVRSQVAIAQALGQGRDVAFTSAASPDAVTAAKAKGAELGLDGTEVSNLIAVALGEVAATAIRGHQLRGVILTGGDTAKAVCRELGVQGLELLRELETGVPLSRMVGGSGLLAVTKAGAFGTEQTLSRAMLALKGEG